jgi:mannitol-1-/sugar-/sorbitol-6-phosphatase
MARPAVPGVPARAAIFDLDGTLVDTEPGAQAALRQLFDGYGVPHDDALLRSFVGRRGPEVFAELAHLFPGHDPGQLSAEVGEYYRGMDLPPAAPFPGAVELVREIHRRGDPLGLVTSGRRQYVLPRLEHLGLLETFAIIVTADDVTAGKPDPEGYLRAREKLAVAAPLCVVFEDSPAGIAAARAGGLYCVAVATTHEPSRLGRADQIVANLTEITWPVLVPST